MNKPANKPSPHSRFIPREEIDGVAAWHFAAVDGSEPRPALRTEADAAGSEHLQAAREQEATTIRAEGQKNAQIIRAEAEANAAKIYAEAFNKDASFYDFYRAMKSYDATFADPENKSSSTLILSPDNDYLRQFRGK